MSKNEEKRNRMDLTAQEGAGAQEKSNGLPDWAKALLRQGIGRQLTAQTIPA